MLRKKWKKKEILFRILHEEFLFKYIYILLRIIRYFIKYHVRECCGKEIINKMELF